MAAPPPDEIARAYRHLRAAEVPPEQITILGVCYVLAEWRVMGDWSDEEQELDDIIEDEDWWDAVSNECADHRDAIAQALQDARLPYMSWETPEGELVTGPRPRPRVEGPWGIPRPSQENIKRKLMRG